MGRIIQARIDGYKIISKTAGIRRTKKTPITYKIPSTAAIF